MSISTGISNPLAKKMIEDFSKRKLSRPTVEVNFREEVKKINPAFKAPICFIKAVEWIHSDNGMPIAPLPRREDWEGEADADGLPKDAQLHQEMLEDAKSKMYALWTQQINDGVFDGTDEAKPTEKQPEPEAIDMAEIARRQKEKEDAPTDTVIVDKTPAEEEAEDIASTVDKSGSPKVLDLGNIKDLPIPEQVEKLLEYNSVIGTPPALKMLSTIRAMKDVDVPKDQHPVIRLREAIEDIARGCVGPGTDENNEERMDRIEAKLDQCIMDIRSLVEFQRVTEPKLTLLEKMKGMFS